MIESAVNPNDVVSVKSIQYRTQMEDWELIDDLMGGTKAMRKAGHKWLPQEPAESSLSYSLRLGRSFLYNAYRDTVRRLASRPFARPVTLSQKSLPEQLKLIADDVDMTGKSLTTLGWNMLTACAKYGGTYLLVDYPEVPAGATLADERANKIRPTFVHIEPPQLLGFDYIKNPAGGPPILQRIRIKETRYEQNGAYGTTSVDVVRVITTNTWELWKLEKTQKGEVWVLEKNGTHNFGAVPLLTCYVNQNGFMTFEPPLMDLAWLNLAHWQSLSDQRNILRIARVGILFGTGFSQEEVEKPQEVSANKIWKVVNDKADLKYVEHSGKAIGAGQKDLESLEERMEVLGLHPMIARSGNLTATGKAIDEAKSQSEVQSWVRSLEGVLYDAYSFAARWTKTKLPEDFAINIFNEFSLSSRAADDIKALQEARKRGDISHETFLYELKRRAVLAEEIDIETEIEKTKVEADAAKNTLGMPEDLLEDDLEQEPAEQDPTGE